MSITHAVQVAVSVTVTGSNTQYLSTDNFPQDVKHFWFAIARSKLKRIVAFEDEHLSQLLYMLCFLILVPSVVLKVECLFGSAKYTAY